MRQYLQYRWQDYLFCVIISTGLSVNVLSGFVIDDVWQRMPVLALTVVVITVACFAASWNKATTIIGIVAAVAALAFVIVLSLTTRIFVHDEENPTLIFFVVVITVTLVVFLACRSRVGIVVVFLAGNFVQAGASFLQFPCELWAYILFLIGCGLMIFYRVYVKSVLQAYTGKVRFKGFLIQNVCVCLAALLLASAIFAGIIRPLDPPTDDLKLIQRLMSFQVLERIGVSSTLVQLDKDKTSPDEPEEEQTTNEPEPEEQAEGAGNAGNTSNGNQGSSSSSGQNSSPAVQDFVEAITYHLKHHWYIYVIILAAIICFLIYLRRLLRKRWLAAIGELSRREGVVNLYELFMFGIAKTGCKRAKSSTLNEYAALNENRLAKFDSGQVTFARVTEIYKKAYYGRQDISNEEYADCLAYYNGFHKNVREVAGRFRYLFLYFRL